MLLDPLQLGLGLLLELVVGPGLVSALLGARLPLSGHRLPVGGVGAFLLRLAILLLVCHLWLLFPPVRAGSWAVRPMFVAGGPVQSLRACKMCLWHTSEVPPPPDFRFWRPVFFC